MAVDKRIAILGTGHMARTMAGAIAGVPGLAVAGFASRDPARAERAARAYGGVSFAGLGAILDSLDIDALYIANDTALHADAALAALRRGMPVLCEKPCAIDAAQAQAIASAAAEHDTLFMEAVATPFLPAVATVLAQASSGKLGTLRQLNASFGYPADATTHPGLFARDGGGVLLDRAVYLVTLAMLAMGDVEKVHAEIRRRDGIDVEASLLLRHISGGASTLVSSLDAELDNRMTIAGTRGTATVESPLLSAEVFRITYSGPTPRAAPASGLRGKLKQAALIRAVSGLRRTLGASRLFYGISRYDGELIHFRDLLLAGAARSPVLPPELSVRVMQVLDRARDCAA